MGEGWWFVLLRFSYERGPIGNMPAIVKPHWLKITSNLQHERLMFHVSMLTRNAGRWTQHERIPSIMYFWHITHIYIYIYTSTHVYAFIYVYTFCLVFLFIYALASILYMSSTISIVKRFVAKKHDLRQCGAPWLPVRGRWMLERLDALVEPLHFTGYIRIYIGCGQWHMKV